MTNTVRVGNAGGYWGDDPHAMRRQLSGGSLDYITQDFLAEITMSILQKQRARQPELGYATDFLDQVSECAPLLKETDTRIISNAGGINPLGCAEKLEEILQKAGLDFKLAVIRGDDLMDQLSQLGADGIELANMESGEPFETIRDRVVSANVYLGAEPVIRALQEGARIILAGRVTDTAITAAAPAYEFGWELEDWDRLAGAVVAGHIIECGAQASGGNLTDWTSVPDFNEIAYPIVEFEHDGSFVVTRHPGQGGLVSRETVVSQLVYEMGDPRNYITPDVVADFTTIRLETLGDDRIRISGVQGSPRTGQFKVSVSYSDGFKAHGTLIVSAPDAATKSYKISEMLWKRLGLEFEATSTDLVGYNACHGRLAPPVDAPEVLLRLGVRDHDRDKVAEFSKVFTSLILNSVSGVAIVGARPRIQEVVAYWPALIPSAVVTPEVVLLKPRRVIAVPSRDSDEKGTKLPPAVEKEEPASAPPDSKTTPVRLSRICYGRSGDKGDTCNIGLVGRSPEAYEWIRSHLTADIVKEHFGELCRGAVECFEVPNLLALNFLLHESLGGGGTVSLSIDPQGKTYADALLMMEVEVPGTVLESLTEKKSSESTL